MFTDVYNCIVGVLLQQRDEAVLPLEIAMLVQPTVYKKTNVTDTVTLL